jgi:hypothetical protein
LAAVEPRFERFGVEGESMDAREHLCHLPQPTFSIARHQLHPPRQTRHDDGGTAACGAYSNSRRISVSSAIGTADEMDRFMKAFKEIFPQKSKTTAAG